MEIFYPFADQIEPPEQEAPSLCSNFEDMIISILSGTPGPRLLPDNEE